MDLSMFKTYSCFIFKLLYSGLSNYAHFLKAFNWKIEFSFSI